MQLPAQQSVVMNVLIPDWALEKYPELADITLGLFEIVYILVVGALPFVSAEQKDTILKFLLFETQFPFLLIFVVVIIATFLFFAILLIGLLDLFRKYIQLQKDEGTDVFLQLKPLGSQKYDSYANEDFLKILHECMAHQADSYSLEIVSTKLEGIQYVLKVPKRDNQLVQKALKSHFPYLKLIQIDDYLSFKSMEEISAYEFSQVNEYPYPISTPQKLDVHDPISYVTESMGKLKSGELVALQNVISRLGKSDTQKQANLLTKIINDEPVFDLIKSTKKLSLVHKLLVWSMRIILLIALPWLVIAYYVAKFLLKKRKVTYTQGQTNLVTSIGEKLEQPLYEVAIRVITKTESAEAEQEKIRGFATAFSPFSNSFQAIKFVNESILNRLSFYQKLRLLSIKNRSLVTSKTSILSVIELASLYHFPNYSSDTTEDLVKTHSKELPAPLSVKNADFDVVFGRSNGSETSVDIGLTDEDRSRHVYILGQTGTGKSTIIFHMAKDDIQKNRGVAIIDPHGDLAEDLLKTIPENRIKDCVYLNPFDLAYPVGINILELTPGLSDDDLAHEKELVCEGVISIFRRIFSNDEKANAHRIEYILRNAIYTAFSVSNATIFTVYELLNNPKFQKTVVKKLDDENLKNFWKNEFGKAGNFQIVKMVSGVTAKIGRFLFSPSAKRILEQPTSTISFDEIIDSEKILICNLAEGKLGEDTSQLLGTTILAKIQQAAMRRVIQQASNRRPFYVFVDEFQNFATSSFTKLLSGGRKFGLRMTIAQQTTAQQENDNVTNVILANTGTVVCFRTASPVDAKLIGSQFQPYVGISDINSLPRYNFYMRLAAVEPEEPFSGVTMPIKVRENNEVVSNVIESSRSIYAIEYIPSKKQGGYQKQVKKVGLNDLKQGSGHSALP